MTQLVRTTRLTSDMSLSLKSSKPPKVFILADCSGSMQGQPMDELKKALHKVWTPTTAGVLFHSEVYSFGIEDIDHLPCTGTTAMLTALKETHKDSPKRIILMTDGHPTDANDETILGYVKTLSYPIDTIGIGPNSANDLLKSISALTNGRYMEVDSPLLLTETLETLMLVESTKPNNVVQL